MSTDNPTSNSNQPEQSLTGLSQPPNKTKKKRYQVTEQQFQAVLESKIETQLRESLSFNSIEEKAAFLKPGNIVTFKNKLPGFPKGQIAIAKVERNQSGAIKLINPFGTESPWYASEHELIKAIDWDWMKQNIIN
jgi:hypothetical protein